MNHTYVMLEHRRVAAEARKAEAAPSLPSVLVPRTGIDVDDERVPRGVRSVYKAALAAGWQARITYAVGPWLKADGHVDEPAVFTMVVAVRNPRTRRRMTFGWRWRADSLEWQNTGAMTCGPEWSVLGITQAKKLLEEGSA